MLKFLLLLNMLNEIFTKARNKQSNLLNMLIFKISMLSLISIFGDFPDVRHSIQRSYWAYMYSKRSAQKDAYILYYWVH
jgi:hypothetical protein